MELILSSPLFYLYIIQQDAFVSLFSIPYHDSRLWRCKNVYPTKPGKQNQYIHLRAQFDDGSSAIRNNRLQMIYLFCVTLRFQR
jgi:hypothetical protein